MRSYKPMVKTVGSDKWSGNGLAFATEDEALNWAYDLMMRWTAVTDYAAHESDDPVSHDYVNRQLCAVPAGATA